MLLWRHMRQDVKLNRIDYKYLKAISDREIEGLKKYTGNNIKDWSGIYQRFNALRLIWYDLIEAKRFKDGKVRYAITFKGHVALAAYLAEHPEFDYRSTPQAHTKNTSS